MARTSTSVVFGGSAGTLVAVIAFYVGGIGPDAENVAEASAFEAAPNVETTVRASATTAAPSGENSLEENIARLADSTSPAERRAAALTLVETAGADRVAIDRVAAELPAPDRLNFTFDALARVAPRNAAAALALAVGLDDQASRTEAVARIARVLAMHDATAALSQAGTIESYALRETFVASLFEALAGADVDGFFALVARSDLGGVTLTVETFETIAAIDAEHLLTRLDELPATMHGRARSVAVGTLVRSDPEAAFRYVDSLPRVERERLFASAARVFALHDADAALEWVKAQRMPSGSIMAGVLQGIGEREPIRAAELLLDTLARGDVLEPSRSLRGILASFTPGPRESLAIVADRFSLARGAPAAAAFATFMDLWSQNDPEAAHLWARTHVDRMTETALTPFLDNLAATRRDLAKDAVSWLPADIHDDALRIVSAALAQTDAADTLRWLAGFRDEAAYARAVQQAIETAAQSYSDTRSSSDPAEIAAFLDAESPEMLARLMPVVADAWARRDGAAAARWVERAPLAESDQNRRTPAFQNVVSRWAESDADAAAEWVLRMRRGEERDRLLGNVLHGMARVGRLDARILAAFSTAEVRERWLASALPNLGQTDPVRARRLIAEHVTDPRLRAQAEAALVRGNRAAPGLTLGEQVIYR